MRNGRFGRLLAGSLLAVTAMAPMPGHAAPDRVLPAVPMPPAANAPQPAATELGMRGSLDQFVPGNDVPVAERLRTIISSKDIHRRIDWAPYRKEVERFYAARHYAPVWVHDGALTARGKAVIARLRNAAADGLDPADYPAPNFGSDPKAEMLAEGDIQITNAVLDYARHLAVGRIAPRRVVSQIEYGDHTPDPAGILKTITQARDINAAFDSFNPPDPGFRALKEKLAELRRSSNDDTGNRIPAGPRIKPGTRDARIPMLRARLHVRGRAHDTRYDRALYNVIRRVQRNADLRPTGFIDSKTLAVINGPTHRQVIDTITANMERWRWLPRDLGQTYVMVNIPDYTLKVVHDNRTVWHTKIVTGKPTTPTPLVSAPMKQVIVNPSWYVPQSIIQNELLPAYQSDPNIFDRMGLEVRQAPDGHINVVQPPGAANALGRIKFVFPNKFQVYLHDTPEKRLFSYDRRAFSHGCMRVQDPTKFGEVMLSLAMDGRTPNARQLNSMFGREERDFKLAKQPMVHLTYQTAFVDDAGKLELRDDLYGIDARIHTIMHSAERRIADVPPPPDPKRDLATLKSSQEILRRVERREAQNPIVFFERLFR